MKKTLMYADKLSKTGHLYPRAEVEKALSKRSEFFGQVGPSYNGILDMSNISHRVTNLELHPDGRVTGDVELLRTPAGLFAESLIANYLVRPESIGSIFTATGSKQEGEVKVMTGITFLSFNLIEPQNNTWPDQEE